LASVDENIRMIAGAMSGTSADGVDVAIVAITGRGLEMRAKLIASHHRPFPPDLRELIGNLRMGTAMPISALAMAGREISLCYAAAVNECLIIAAMNSSELAAVAAHGQTLFHDPPDTIQWLDPALVAAEVGSPGVSDFRRADCAAGGQGAPLVPMADYLLFRDAQKNRVLLNIGGIANLTYLPVGCGINGLIAFDTGPGNCLSDHLIRQANPGGAGWDEGGQVAAAGVPVYPIVQRVLASPYFAQMPPKSTDGPAMIKLFSDALAEMGRRYPLEYLVRSACLISADAILEAMRKFLKPFPDEIIVSGGGTKNPVMMDLLRQPMEAGVVKTTEELGVPSESKEAMAFALLGAATLDGLPGNVPAATGAARPVVLGAVWPAP
jgi:anhydro-N-acetylmuramic acid kinase